MGHTKTKKEKEHVNKVARLGCIICRKEGNPLVDAELHHIRSMTGLSKRATNFEVIPLCVRHHRLGKESFHYSSRNFSSKWGSQQELLDETLELLKLENELWI